ncbi:hypothetical protein [Acidianus brierleyi]|uniref:Uncharacterized protein n=1 Tax=Acidianus brierleyi TaxID=41673 RepID=A0A2U9IB74_9CREN|nr:hypothetical protein [Acidianus brierleyi]AWR93277.1 hypothetical protein DFR85_00280 [Acidianus brierleyi]
MSSNLDPVQIAKMPFTERNDAIMHAFNLLLNLDDKSKLEAFKGLLTALGTKAKDEEYINWCDSTLRVLSMYPDDVIKAVLSLRMKAVSELPKELQEKDQKMVTQVLNGLDPSIKEKILKEMKS